MMRPYAALGLCVLLALLLQAGSGIQGHYVGNWSGESGASGKFDLGVTTAADKTACKVSFTYAGEEIQTNVTLCKTDISTLDVQYDFDLGGNRLQSTIHGELKGDALTGKYQTKALADGSPVDEGDWKATLAR